MKNKCSLCGLEKPLRESHIIPKFVGKWTKSTAVTQGFGKVTNPSKIFQDLDKEQLLCKECEELFSKFESYFARKIFYPFHNKTARSFEYNETLEKFVVSLSWRILKSDFDEEFRSEYPKFAKQIEQAELDWRNFLLGKKPTTKPYEHHFVLLGHVEANYGFPEDINWYLLRTIDATLDFINERIFVYVKLPWMFFVSSIHPKTIDGWEGTLIKNNGTIKMPQNLEDLEFGTYLQLRCQLAQINLEGKEKEKNTKQFLKSIEKNPEKFLSSQTFEIMNQERILTRREEMKNMPESIIELVEDIILRIPKNPTQQKSENNKRELQRMVIADALAKLSREESETLDTIISTTLNQASLLKTDAKMMIKTNSIWLTFIVNPKSNKEYQREKIREELEELKEIRGNINIPLVVFSLNPIEQPQWELGYII